MLIGVDEAGRGPIIGPMVVAAAAVDDDAGLRREHVRDSKKYSTAARDRAFAWLKETVCYSTVILTAEDIDRMRRTKTLNAIEVEAFASVLMGLYRRLSPELHDMRDMLGTCHIYVDSCDVNEKRFGSDLADALCQMVKTSTGEADIRAMILDRIVSTHRADTLFPVVSAASVIAKGTREEKMERIREEIGTDAGSGYPSDPATRKFLEGYLRDHGRFPPHTRLSWETARKLRNKVSATTLMDF